MARPKKKQIVLNKDSVLSLMQEIYNELVEQRATAIRIQNKMLAMLKDPEDMTVIGPVIKEQQKIVNDTIEKKLSLSKLQSSIWEKTNSQATEEFSLSDIDDDTLQTLIQQDLGNDDKKDAFGTSISKYIKYFENFNPELVFDKENLIVIGNGFQKKTC